MRKISLLVLLGMVFFLSKINAQSKVIPVWNGKIPGSVSNPAYIAQTDSDSNWVWAKNISTPVMDVYLAPSGKANGTAVVICPGGGYSVLAIKHEGAQIAQWFNSMGITAIVLKYRLPEESIMVDKTIGPLQDAQEAIRSVRRHAKEWNINPSKVGIMGFSAGGHLASTLSTHYNDKVYDVANETSARPDFSILIYPVISMDTTITHRGSRDKLLGTKPSEALWQRFSNELQVNAQTPPAFLVHSLNDNVVPVQNSINYALAMAKYKVPCELHIYEKGGHGYGLGRSNGTESTWGEACKNWLKMRGLL